VQNLFRLWTCELGHLCSYSHILFPFLRVGIYWNFNFVNAVVALYSVESF